jgi:hypothetical protein
LPLNARSVIKLLVFSDGMLYHYAFCYLKD